MGDLFGTFGMGSGFGQGFGGPGNSDDQERNALAELGINLAKNPLDEEVDDELRGAAQKVFKTYAAYIQAGFTPGEALRLITVSLGGTA